jgi:hypothetical protein
LILWVGLEAQAADSRVPYIVRIGVERRAEFNSRVTDRLGHLKDGGKDIRQLYRRVHFSRKLAAELQVNGPFISIVNASEL